MTKITSALEPDTFPGIPLVGPDGLAELDGFESGSGISQFGEESFQAALDALPPNIVLPSEVIDVSILEELANRSETGACQALVALREAMLQIHGSIGAEGPISWSGGNFRASYNTLRPPVVFDILDRCPPQAFLGVEGLREATQLAVVVIGTVILTLGVGTVAAGIGGATGTVVQTVGDLAQAQLTSTLVPDAPPVVADEPTTAERFLLPALAAAGIVVAAVLLR